jgi:predicted phosphoribosyltransferase
MGYGWATAPMTVFTEKAVSQRRPFRFPDLRSGGRDLALALELEHYRSAANTVVLAIVSGGVPVAHEVAKHLNAPLDLIFNRTLLTPQGPGSQVSAVNVAGSLVLPAELLPRPVLPSTPFDFFLADALTALEQRARICRRERPQRDLSGQNVIVVDCGIRTGLTMQPAVVALRTKKPARIIAAVPVGSADGCAAIAAITDEFVCLAEPEPFGHVGMWYEDFRRPDDEQIHELLDPT